MDLPKQTLVATIRTHWCRCCHDGTKKIPPPPPPGRRVILHRTAVVVVVAAVVVVAVQDVQDVHVVLIGVSATIAKSNATSATTPRGVCTHVAIGQWDPPPHFLFPKNVPSHSLDIRNTIVPTRAVGRSSHRFRKTHPGTTVRATLPLASSVARWIESDPLRGRAN